MSFDVIGYRQTPCHQHCIEGKCLCCCFLLKTGKREYDVVKYSTCQQIIEHHICFVPTWAIGLICVKAEINILLICTHIQITNIYSWEMVIYNVYRFDKVFSDGLYDSFAQYQTNCPVHPFQFNYAALQLHHH